MFGAAADRVAAALDPDLLWAAGGLRCVRVTIDTLRIVDANGETMLKYRLPGVDLDLLR